AYTSAAFADKTVGGGKNVSVSGISISGADVDNYTLQNTSASASASITARPLTVTATGVDKVYDGTANASVNLGDNKLSGDDLSEGYSSATFSDKNVGTGKSVSVVGIGLSGVDAGNYALQNTSASTTASITLRPLTVSASGINKTYDGTTAGTVALSDN